MRLLCLGCVLFFCTQSFSARALEAERLFYLSGGEVCIGCIYKPTGKGPFPAVIFNQSMTKSLPETGKLDPFPELARFYTSHQFILFAPGRRNLKQLEQAKLLKGGTEERKFQLHQIQTESIYSAVETLKAQADVDPAEIYVTGYSQGATDSLLLAEKEIDVRAFVAFSPALSENLILQNAVRDAVRTTKTPVFLIQMQNDAGLASLDSVVLLLQEKGAPNLAKTYSPGKNAGTLFAINSPDVWGNDVLSFFKATPNGMAKEKPVKNGKRRNQSGALTIVQ